MTASLKADVTSCYYRLAQRDINSASITLYRLQHKNNHLRKFKFLVNGII